jgi:hypothetical protein
MFPYDGQLAVIVQTLPNSIPDVLATMKAIDALCMDGDGLKWFNLLYLQVTTAVEARVASGGFGDSAWLAELDVQFARLYFEALGSSLAKGICPGCWWALFSKRNDTPITRIQFAIAGINAHINHDLCEALVATCQSTNTTPRHGGTQYKDFTDLNTTLDALIETAKGEMDVRLLGDSLPPVTHLEDTLAAWGTAAAREQAWNNGEILWHLQGMPALVDGFLDGLDGITTLAGKALLVPVP